jgi:hypothetical protein
VSSLALAQANILARNGRPQEATELLLDVTVFARDLSANGVLLAHLIGLDIYSKTLDGLRDLILSGKMDRKNLADLAKKLETVDRDFPGMGPTMANETLAYGINLLHYIEGGLPPEEWWTSIKEAGLSYRFFSQKMALGAFESRYDYLERSRKFDQMEFSAVMKESNAIMAEAEASWNPLLRIGLPSLPIILTKYRETQARLRLLRAAAVVLATGEVQSIPDPFGKDLSYIQKAGKLRIQSERQDISLEISK